MGQKQVDQDRRRDQRRKIYVGEGIRCRLAPGTDRTVLADVVDMSPHGAGLLTEASREHLLPKRGAVENIQFQTRDGQKFSIQCKICSVRSEFVEGQEFKRIGISFYDQVMNPYSVSAHTHIVCGQFFQAVGWYQDPFFFQERVHFHVAAISPHGVILLTSARNKTLLPNLVVKANVYLPLITAFDVRLKVKFAHLPSQHPYGSDKEGSRYAVETLYDNPSLEFREALSEYLLLFGTRAEIQRMREVGFQIHSLEKAMSLYYAASDEDFRGIRRLYSEIYKVEVDDLSGDEIVGEAKSDLQLISYVRYMMIKVGRNLAGSLKILFVEREKKRSEIQTQVAIPDSIWMYRFLELTQLFWHPAYRETDMFIHILRHIVRLTIESNHTHLLTTADEKLVGAYQRVGFRPLDIRYYDRSRKLTMQLFLMDAKSLLHSPETMEKKVWLKIFAPVARHLGIKPSP